MTAKIPTSKVEDMVYDAQIKWINERFGPGVATNLGWGVGGGDDYVSVASKVYGHGILVTEGNTRGEIKHEFSKR